MQYSHPVHVSGLSLELAQLFALRAIADNEQFELIRLSFRQEFEGCEQRLGVFLGSKPPHIEKKLFGPARFPTSFESRPGHPACGEKVSVLTPRFTVRTLRTPQSSRMRANCSEGTSVASKRL